MRIPPERMVLGPDRYFADARQRAIQELIRQARWLFQGFREKRQSTATLIAPAAPVTVARINTAASLHDSNMLSSAR